MEFKFNVTGENRKALVAAMTELLNTPQKYLGAPTFAYKIGDYRIEKDGTVTGEYSLSLMAALEQKGFEYETEPTFHLITPRGTFLIKERFDTAAEAEAAGYGMHFTHENHDVYIRSNGKSEHGKEFAVVGAPFEKAESAPEPEIAAEADIDSVCIEYPLDGFTPEALDNLTKMVLAKEPLIRKALGAEKLPIQVLEDRIRFDWFRLTEDNGEIHAYSQFITALCKTAKEKKRVTAKAPESFENEKFAMRVWLIGLGLVGKEYAACRKLMMANLSGNAAWRYGASEKAATSAE